MEHSNAFKWLYFDQLHGKSLNTAFVFNTKDKVLEDPSVLESNTIKNTHIEITAESELCS